MRLTKYIYIISTLVLSLFSCTRDVDTIAVQDFFVKAERSSFKVSPDGRYIAYIGLEDNRRNIYLLDTDKPELKKQLTFQKDVNVNYFFWATKDTIVYSQGQLPKDNRFLLIDIHTGKSRYLLPSLKNELRWVSPLTAINGNLLAQMNLRDSTIFDLYRIPLSGDDPILVEENTQHMTTWVPSLDGQVRLAISTDSTEDKVWYRNSEAEPFVNVLNSDYVSTLIPFGPYRDSTSLYYVLSNIGKDKLGLSLFDFKTGKQKVLVENQIADLNKEGYSYSLGDMIYTSVSEIKKQITVSNDKLQLVFDKIKNKYEGYNIDIVDTDATFNVVIFKLYTDVDPGMILYYSAQQDSFHELISLNPNLENVPFSKMEPITYNSRDGRTINGFLTLPLQEQSKYPVVVLVHDGPNHKDNWGFSQEVQFLANRGYAVFQVNYRGSTGFGKSFIKAGFKQWGGEIQNDISDGVSWLIHQGVADKNRIAIMGTGFGGYSALYAACFNPTLYKCAISSSGYTNLFTYLKEIPPYYQQYLQMYYRIVGDPTKEYELFKAISPLFHADKIRMPILMFQGGKDRYHSVTDINQFVQRVKNNGGNIKYTYFEDEGRRIRKEENIILYYQEVENFLKNNL